MNKLILPIVLLSLTACSHSTSAGSTDTTEAAETTEAIELTEPQTEETPEPELAENAEESVRKFIADMYATVLPAVTTGQGDKYVAKYFSPSLLGLYEKVERYDRENCQGEIGCFDCEMWTRSQDPDADIKASVESLTIDGNTANATVSLKGLYYSPTEVKIRLIKTDEGWKIADYDGIESVMKSYLGS